MRHPILLTLCLTFIIGFTFGQSDFQKSVSPGEATLLQKGEAKTWCPVCGMNLPMFYKTNHARVLEDGSAYQYCSIRCLLVDGEKHPDGELLVIDAQKEKFIPTEKAYYVVGSDVPGTMTMESKIAFGSKRAARKFSKNHGGDQLLRFHEVTALAEEQLAADDKVLMKKKQKMVIPKGKGLYNNLKLTAGDLGEYASLLDLKANLKSLDKTARLGEKQLQMLALYIWMGKGQEKKPAVNTSLVVPESAKCPVCGMFVYKYPQWAASLEFGGASGEILYFDGVKDLMKYYFQLDAAKRSAAQILVTDYYSQKAIDGRAAYFVIGSDVLGPMGHELIPAKTSSEAETFLGDHSGTKTYNFSELTESIVIALDK